MSYNTPTYLIMRIIILNKLHMRSNAGFNYISKGINEITQNQYRDSALRQYTISALIVSPGNYNRSYTIVKRRNKYNEV